MIGNEAQLRRMAEFEVITMSDLLLRYDEILNLSSDHSILFPDIATGTAPSLNKGKIKKIGKRGAARQIFDLKIIPVTFMNTENVKRTMQGCTDKLIGMQRDISLTLKYVDRIR